MTATVVRIKAPSGNQDHDYYQPQCRECGWKGDEYSNRTIEGRSIAEARAAEHRCRTYNRMHDRTQGRAVDAKLSVRVDVKGYEAGLRDCAVCARAELTAEPPMTADRIVTVTGPNGMQLPTILLCTNHAIELLEGE